MYHVGLFFSLALALLITLSLCFSLTCYIAKLSPSSSSSLAGQAELALFLLNPATPPTPTPSGKFIFKHFSVNVDQVTLQEYIRTQIGRRPKYFRQMEDDLNFLGKWKTTSILRQIGKQSQFFRQMEETSIFSANGRRPQLLRQTEDDLKFLGKWKTTSIF